MHATASTSCCRDSMTTRLAVSSDATDARPPAQKVRRDPTRRAAEAPSRPHACVRRATAPPRIAFVLACGVAAHIAGHLLAPAPAAAEPSAAELRDRRAALETRLAGQGFTVVVEPPFVVLGDEPAATVKRRASGILRWSIRLLEAEYFPARPHKIVEIWLFKNERTYRRGAQKFFGDTPDTPYGYYSPDRDAMVMNIGPGAGTLVHEVVHPYMEANFPEGPSWFNEGLASLYEYPTEKNGHIWGLPNWRLPNLKKQIANHSLPALATLLASSRDEFYDAPYDAYAYARYLVLYLQDHGKLTAFYKAFIADQTDRTGKTALEAVLGESLDTFEPTWRAWAAALKR